MDNDSELLDDIPSGRTAELVVLIDEFNKNITGITTLLATLAEFYLFKELELECGDDTISIEMLIEQIERDTEQLKEKFKIIKELINGSDL